MPRLLDTRKWIMASKKRTGIALIATGVVMVVTVGVVLAVLGDTSSNSESSNTIGLNDLGFGADVQFISAPPTNSPVPQESILLVTLPSASSSDNPTGGPSQAPSADPSSLPSLSTSPSPAPSISKEPSDTPSACPSDSPSTSAAPTFIAYAPGNLTVVQGYLLLSSGLQSRLLARSGLPVQYDGVDAAQSSQTFHHKPDFGACFEDTRPENPGGWVYTSNAEVSSGGGGVGAITFDRNGNMVDYKMVLQQTTRNCGGGPTPWNTWVSCEETGGGKIYQVDPHGIRPGQLMTLGMEGGHWESFAYDIRNKDQPRFFATEDRTNGCLRRYTPDDADWDGDQWEILHGPGIVDYLFLSPNESRTGGTYTWINDRELAKNNARMYYPETEGVDISEHEMFVVCKNIKQIFTFNLDDMTYINQSTFSGLFDGHPDQMKRILNDDSELLYFTEDGGRDPGIHARDAEDRFYTILESPVLSDETTGLSFSPDGMHMYVAYQHTGLLYEIWREDNQPFHAKTLNVKYHATGSL